MSAEERFSLLESKLSTFAQRAESQASLIDDLRFQQEQQAALATSSLSPVWHLLHVLYSLATNSARTGLPFWLLLPVTAPRAALEYVATAIVDIVPSEKAYGAHSYGGARIREVRSDSLLSLDWHLNPVFARRRASLQARPARRATSLRAPRRRARTRRHALSRARRRPRLRRGCLVTRGRSERRRSFRG